MSGLLVDRAVKASHVLMSGTGQVCLTGLSNVLSTMTPDRRVSSVFSYPDPSTGCLQWLSPEILEQVPVWVCRHVCHLTNPEILEQVPVWVCRHVCDLMNPEFLEQVPVWVCRHVCDLTNPEILEQAPVWVCRHVCDLINPEMLELVPV